MLAAAGVGSGGIFRGYSMSVRQPRVLVVDDEHQDQVLSEIALSKGRFGARITALRDGQELMDYLERRPPWDNPERSPRPHLILLDLRMARRDGRAALRALRAHPDLRHLVVVVMSNSREGGDVLDAYRLGANAYIAKPADFNGLVEAVRSLETFWFELAELPDPG